MLMVAENVRFDPLFQKAGECSRGCHREAGAGADDPAVLPARSFLNDRPWFLDTEGGGRHHDVRRNA